MVSCASVPPKAPLESLNKQVEQYLTYIYSKIDATKEASKEDKELAKLYNYCYHNMIPNKHTVFNLSPYQKKVLHIHTNILCNNYVNSMGEQDD
jgi:hypothetical protein